MLHTHIQRHIHTNAHTHMHIHMLHTHTCTHTDTEAHTHNVLLPSSLWSSSAARSSVQSDFKLSALARIGSRCVMWFCTSVDKFCMFKSKIKIKERIMNILGAGHSSEVEPSLMVWWVIGSILHGVDPLSYFSFQPVLHDWPWYVLSCLWDGAYKRTLAVNRWVAYVAAAGFLSHYPCVWGHITVDKMCWVRR